MSAELTAIMARMTHAQLCAFATWLYGFVQHAKPTLAEDSEVEEVALRAARWIVGA